LNLDHFSEGFPAANSFLACSEPVTLPESGETLRLLMQYMHKARYPRLQTISLDQLFKLAEAAEKYLVYSASSACSQYIE